MEAVMRVGHHNHTLLLHIADSRLSNEMDDSPEAHHRGLS
jgi:hypothetical protein